MPRGGRRALRWGVAGVVVLLVLAVGAPFVYIHFIEGPAPVKLSLPTTSVTSVAGPASHAASSSATSSTAASTGEAAPASLSSATSVDGLWHVGAGSIVGYRVQEVLVGQHSTAVGRTTKVWGSLTISGTSVTKGSFIANMASVKSDQSERNAQFAGRIMDVAGYPTATFTLTSPIFLGAVPATGAVKSFPATGDLTMHGVTKPVHFVVSAERSGASIYVLADIDIVFANWDISNPSVGGFVTTSNSGTLEVLLHLTKGPGNPASTSSSTGVPQFGGPGAPITVPSTTVPPLRVP